MRLFSAPRSMSLFDRATSRPDGTLCADPCLFGVRPGETPAAEARMLLDTHPITEDAEWIAEDVLKLPDLNEYVFVHATSSGVVDSIGMTVMMDDMDRGRAAGIGTSAFNETATLDEFMLKFGVDNIVFQGNAFVAFPDARVGVLAVTSQPDHFMQHVRLDAPITSLTVTVIPMCSRPEFGADDAWHTLVTLKHSATRRASLRITAYHYSIPTLGVCWG